MTEAVIIQKSDWFLYDNALRRERVKKLFKKWFDNFMCMRNKGIKNVRDIKGIFK